jgi:hypothetical protein
MRLKIQFILKLLILACSLSSCRDIEKVKTEAYQEISLLPKINNQYSCTPDDAFFIKESLYFYCKSAAPKDSAERKELRTSVENSLNQWIKNNLHEKRIVFVYFTDERAPLTSKK